VSGVKQVVRKATGWLVDPIVGQVNSLRLAMIEALEHEPGDEADGHPRDGG
jgi:hypothetical protein